MERKFQGARWPGNERARERGVGQGANRPESYWPIRSGERIGPGAKRLGTLSTVKSANIGFSQVAQLFAPPTNPAYAAHAKNSFYKFGKKFMNVHNVHTNIRV